MYVYYELVSKLHNVHHSFWEGKNWVKLCWQIELGK